jgi:hypothetical protein
MGLLVLYGVFYFSIPLMEGLSKRQSYLAWIFPSKWHFFLSRADGTHDFGMRIS